MDTSTIVIMGVCFVGGYVIAVSAMLGTFDDFLNGIFGERKN